MKYPTYLSSLWLFRGHLDGNLRGFTWKISKYVHSCTLLKSLHSLKANRCLKSCQQFCRVESFMSEEHRIWLHFLQFSLEPVCKDLNGTLFKSSKHEVLFSSTKLVVNMSVFCCLATNTVKMYNQTSFNSCKTEIGL